MRLRRLVAALAASTAAVPLSAAAAPARAEQPAPPPGQEVTLDGMPSKPYEITLITGDKVKLTDTGGGRYQIDRVPATRPDGTSPALITQSGPKGVYTVPEDAYPAVQAGRVDKELFNVKYLAENGYTDDRTEQFPVIVQYPKTSAAASVRSSADAIPASAPTTQLESIHASGLNVAKAEAATFWQAVRAVPTSARGMAAVPGTLRGGISKVWLDAKVKVDLAESVPMIGAPAAWAAGFDGTGVKVAVLDTGIDTGHPDLAGKVTESRSFIEGQDVQDGHGHGTHVASTIVGSGAASGGRNKGVAPGAQLIVGKVLDNSGSGEVSGVIEGMEWAAHSGAKLVSMSLGGDPTDGTDPGSQAVDNLTAETGTLFVLAAGNLGAAETINMPGAAESALTVAAVDKSDKLADFSSQGPRLGGGLKPDIAAPGANIVAARAAGTTMGTPVDDHYTGASGTSMATPHVAGAAAILAQEHPDWKAAQLKAALMSTAKDDGLHVYQQGAGRVDLARATTQQVFAATAHADFGQLDESGTPLTRELAYTNLGDQPVTLTLKPSLRSTNGTVVEGRLAVADATLTVPAKGSATTELTLSPDGLGLGKYTGSVVAEAGDVHLTTPVGAVREAPTFDLTIHSIDRDGKPRTPIAQDVLDIDGDKGSVGPHMITGPGTVVTKVPAGTVSVTQLLEWVDGESRSNHAWLVDPEVTVTGDTEITLDARKSSQIRFDTQRPAEPLNNNYTQFFQRTTASGEAHLTTVLFGTPIGSWDRLWVLPTKKVTKGTFRFNTAWVLGQSEIAMSVREPRGTTLHPAANLHWYGKVDAHPDWRPFTGTQDLRVVDVGLGRPEELAGRDLRGKLVLMGAEDSRDIFGNASCGAQIERIGPIRDAGAAGIAVYPIRDSPCPIPLPIWQLPFTGEPKPIGIPLAHLSSAEGLRLSEQAAKSPVTIRVSGTPETPYSYVLAPYFEGRIPASLRFSLRDRDLARVDTNVHAAKPTPFQEWDYIYKQDDLHRFSVGQAAADTSITGPKSRPKWIWPLDRNVIHSQGMSSAEQSRWLSSVFDRPGRTSQEWFALPSTPGAGTVPAKVAALADPAAGILEKQGVDMTCALCVQGNKLWASFFEVSGTGERRDYASGFWRRGEILAPAYDLHLYRDGVEIPSAPGGGPFTKVPRFTLAQEPGTYRLTAKYAGNDVEWTFSAPPGKEHVQPGFNCTSWFMQGYAEQCRPVPAVFVSYDLGDRLRLDNTVAARGELSFSVEAYHSDSAAAMPAIAGLRVWASTDDGASWQPATLKRAKDGTYTAKLKGLRPGQVSLKAEAWDTAGNTVKQTTLRTFTMTAP
ncbi:S8 family serine peptidase [Nonomuraea sp. MG754425]|uniref:S8 family peptidase n=1 Tax=Nonomuraea sp. MG754425 TaxID=2570319 RepID=UPI001F00CE01|nr:S8 family serine peptidase [Nonomuraea sp. MG754425]